VIIFELTRFLLLIETMHWAVDWTLNLTYDSWALRITWTIIWCSKFGHTSPLLPEEMKTTDESTIRSVCRILRKRFLSPTVTTLLMTMVSVPTFDVGRVYCTVKMVGGQRWWRFATYYPHSDNIMDDTKWGKSCWHLSKGWTDSYFWSLDDTLSRRGNTEQNLKTCIDSMDEPTGQWTDAIKPTQWCLREVSVTKLVLLRGTVG
jgi:hypothetical protein